MSSRAFAAALQVASAAWLASFAAGCSSAETSPGPVTLRYVTHRVQADADFRSVREYFTGEEDHGGDIVLHSDPGDRRGLYFMVAAGRTDSLPGGVLALVEQVRSDSVAPMRHLFVTPPFRSFGLARELRLGFTGVDWPKDNPSVVAWKISLWRAGDRAPAEAGSVLRIVSDAVADPKRELGAAKFTALLKKLGPPDSAMSSFLWELPAAGR